MSWIFLILLLLLLFSFSFCSSLSEGGSYDPKKSAVVVVGNVYCETCFQDFSRMTSHFISGASVTVECKDGSSPSSFLQQVKTNKHGEFKVHLPFSAGESVKKIKGCSVKLIRSSEPYCALASTPTSSSLNLMSREHGTHVFSAGFFTFKPLKCDQKPSVHNPKELETLNHESLISTASVFPPDDPVVAPPTLYPNQFLPPNPFQPPPLIPPIPNPFQPPPAPLIPNPFQPPPAPLIPNPFQPPPAPAPLIPNPFQPPPAPPAPLIPNPFQPPPAPPAPSFPFPPIPGLTPPPSPPPAPAFPFPFPPIHFPPIPGLTSPPPPPPPPPPAFPFPLPPIHFPPLPPFPGIPPAPTSPKKSSP